jgi:hypothetical protein
MLDIDPITFFIVTLVLWAMMAGVAIYAFKKMLAMKRRREEEAAAKIAAMPKE